jgi:hypothetical protein
MALKSRSILSLLAVFLMTACKKEEATLDDTPASMATTGEIIAINESIPILVIADGYTSNQDSRIQTFITTKLDVATAVEPFNRFSQRPFSLVKVENLKASMAYASTLGLIPVADQNDCYFRFQYGKKAFLKALDTVKATLPPATLTIVLMQVDSGKNVGACAVGDNLILTSQKVSATSLAHEFGHSLAGLEDEAFLQGTAFHTLKPYGEPNCSDNRASPGWEMYDSITGAKLDPKEGCDSYESGLFRPTSSCRMIDPAFSYCCVCRTHILRQIRDRLHLKIAITDPVCKVVSPAPDVTTTVRSTGKLITVDFYSMSHSEVVASEDVAAFDARATLITGEFFASIAVDDKVIGARSMSGDPAFARAYAPDFDAIDQQVEAPLPSRLSIFVPMTTKTQFDTYVFRLAHLAGKKLLTDQVRNDLSAQVPP